MHELQIRVQQVADVAATHAATVDAENLPPVAAIAAMKDHALLGRTVDRRTCWSAGQIVATAATLGRACSSTGAIWAMSRGQLETIACVGGGADVSDFLVRVDEEQPLIASVLRTSLVADASPSDGDVALESRAASYLASSDYALIAVPDEAGGSDRSALQLAATAKAITFRAVQPWDGIGMRGTGSGGASFDLRLAREAVLTVPVDVAQTSVMNPVTHLGWAGVWLGIARGALEVTRQFLRRRGPSEPEQVRQARFLHHGRLREQYWLIDSAVREYARAIDVADAMDDPAARWRAHSSLDTNHLRLAASDQCVAVVLGCLETVGISGYKTSGAAALDRPLRDILSSKVMISGDRLRSTNALLALMSEMR